MSDWYKRDTNTYHRGDAELEVGNVRKPIYGMTAEERAALTLEPTVRGPQPDLDRYKDVREIKSGPNITYKGVLKTPDEVKTERKARVTALRKEKERGGYTVNGVPLRTDPESQGKLSSVVALFDRDTTMTSVDWEAQPGVWATIDKATAVDLAVKVGRYVQGVFSACKAHHDAIDTLSIKQADGVTQDDAATVDAVLAYDIQAGWPASEV